MPCMQRSQILKAGNETEASSLLEAYSKKASEEEVAAWSSFFRKLVVKYKDGQIVQLGQYSLTPTKLFYPRYWLNYVGYWKAESNLLAEPANASKPLLSLVSHAAVALVALTAGLVIGRIHGKIGQRRTGLTAKLLGI